MFILCHSFISSSIHSYPSSLPLADIGTQNQTAAAVVAGDNINVSNPFDDPIAGGVAAGGVAAAAGVVGGPSHGAPPPPPHSPHTAPQSNNQHHQQGIPTQLPPPSQQPPAPPPQQHGPPSTQHARPATGVPYPQGTSGYPSPVSRTPGISSCFLCYIYVPKIHLRLLNVYFLIMTDLSLTWYACETLIF